MLSNSETLGVTPHCPLSSLVVVKHLDDLSSSPGGGYSHITETEDVLQERRGGINAAARTAWVPEVSLHCGKDQK